MNNFSTTISSKEAAPTNNIMQQRKHYLRFASSLLTPSLFNSRSELSTTPQILHTSRLPRIHSLAKPCAITSNDSVFLNTQKSTTN